MRRRSNTATFGVNPCNLGWAERYGRRRWVRRHNDERPRLGNTDHYPWDDQGMTGKKDDGEAA